MILTRQAVRPFTDKQIELCRLSPTRRSSPSRTPGCSTRCRRARANFEALEQQTATSEVLKASSRSPASSTGVRDAGRESATRLCEAHFGRLFQRRDDLAEAAAIVGARRRSPRILTTPPSPTGPAVSPGQRCWRRGRFTFADVSADPEYTSSAAQEIAATEPSARRHPDSCAEGNVDRLVIWHLPSKGAAVHVKSRSSWSNNFAAQAVIAIENTRLLNELRDAPRLRIAAAADRHRRRAQGHQPLDLRSADRARYPGRVGSAAVRGGDGVDPSSLR